MACKDRGKPMNDELDLAAPAPSVDRSVPERSAANDQARRMPLVFLCGLALIVGVVTGFGAVVFRALIGLVHNVLFLGQLSVNYDTSVFTAMRALGRLGHPGAGHRRASA